MTTRKINGNTYSEFAIVAADPIPVDIQGATLTLDADGVEIKNDVGNPIPINDAGGSITVDGPLTDAQLRDAAVPVSGPITDGQLRATPVPVSGPLSDTQLRATPVPISDGGGSLTVDGPLTDAQLRNTAVPVSGPLTDGQLRATPVPVSGPLSDTQLRATPVSTAVPARAPTTTSVASSTSSVTILAQNTNRRGFSIANDSTATLRLSFATPATSANAFIVLAPGAFILLDQQLIVTGIIYGIWSAVNGTAQVTEYI